MSSLPKYPTSQFEESEEVKVFDKHIEDAATQAPTTTKPHLSETLAAMPDAPSESILAEAVALAEYEKTAPFWQSLRLDWRIILFCCAYILPAIGQGLDNGVNNIAVNMPAFLIKFGEFNPTTKSLFMPSLWLGLWNAMTSLGNAIGSYGTGVMTDRFGYRYSQAAGCAISLGFVCLQVFAVNREMILFGKLLNGIPMGMFVAVSAGYISEISGERTRALTMTILAATPILGVTAGVGIGGDDNVIGNVTSDWGSWKLVFALQWILPALTIPLVLLAPESPTSLVKAGKTQAALAALKRMRPTEDEGQTRIRLASVQLAVSSSIDEASTQSQGYSELFKGVELKRTLTTAVLLCGPQFAGVALLSNGLYFLGQTGLDFKTIVSITLAFLGVSAVVVISSTIWMESLGRRSTMLRGLVFHIGLMSLIGALHYLSSTSGLIAAAVLFNFAILTAQFCTSGPAFALAAEIPSLRLRAKTHSFAFGTYYIVGWVFLFAVPYMFQPAPQGGGWGLRACWFFAGMSFLYLIFAYFFVGETKGKSFADIDELYHNRVSPRKFAETQVSAERKATA